jgi:hypothetical protein
MPNWHLLAIDCLDSPIPSREGFFEVYFDCMTDVIVISFEENVWFLEKC